MRIDVCAEMATEMCADVCMPIGVRIDMCAEMCTDMCVDMCMIICADVCAEAEACLRRGREVRHIRLNQGARNGHTLSSDRARARTAQAFVRCIPATSCRRIAMGETSRNMARSAGVLAACVNSDDRARPGRARTCHWGF